MKNGKHNVSTARDVNQGLPSVPFFLLPNYQIFIGNVYIQTVHGSGLNAI